MNNDAMDVIKNSLSQKITVYLDEDTNAALQKDFRDFETKDISKLINLLVENCVTEYFETIYASIPDIKRKLLEAGCSPETIDQTAKSIAFAKATAVNPKRKLNRTVNFRLNKKVVNKAVEALYNGPVSLDYSAFFRSMFLSYLSFPVYKREQIVYKQEIDLINSQIERKEKVSYTRKDTGKSHKFNPYTVEPSSHELFNYLIGQFDNGERHKSSIRISKIKDLVPIHEKLSFSENFEECYRVMNQNGIQFAFDEVEIRSVTLNEKQYGNYERRYLDRPVIIKETSDNGLHTCYFNCSKFQLEAYFTPFDDDSNRIIIKPVPDFVL